MTFTRYLWVLVLASGLANAADIDGTITYQAQIKQNGSPANGTFDFEFKLFDSGTVGQGSQSGQTVVLSDIALVNGQLAAPLNFGAANPFNGTALFLQIGIRDGSSNQAYTLLNPRQRLTEVPYASHSVEADFALLTGANSVNGGSIQDGTVGSADVNATQVQRRVTGTCAVGSAIRVVAQDGTVTCEAVGGGGSGGGDVTSVNTAIGSGLAGGNVSGDINLSIANSGVTTAMILDNTITANDIGPSAVGTTEINETQVQRRVTGACATGQVLQSVNQDGTVVCVQGGGGSGGGWGLTGNSGTNGSTNFVGTTDAQPLVIKANGVRAAQYTFAAGFVNPLSSGTGINVLQGDPNNSITSGVLGGTIAGGGRASTAVNPNIVTDAYGMVGGGYGNVAGNSSGTTTDAISATVAGGHFNRAQGDDSTVGGGSENIASGEQSTVGGGNFNTASGVNALIPGGRGNVASGTNSVVVGNCGTASGPGTILIAAHSNPTSCSQKTASGTETVTVIAGSGGVVLAQGSGSWSSLSDRNTKHAVVPVDSDSILSGVLAMPIATWTYKTQADGIRHMGPMAQDFYSQFNLGEDEKRINSVDIDGVALAAIQGLNAKLERENGELREKNTELEQRLIRLEQTLLGTERNAGR